MIGDRRISKLTLVLLAVLAYCLQALLVKAPQLNPWYQLKVESARVMEAALQVVQEECTRQGIPLETRYDPNRTCLIGPSSTEIVTDHGTLESKLIVTNPSFAAVVVDMLKQAGVQRGDTVAVAFTGSMPGANIAVLAACEVLGVHPLIISSVGSSSFGATRPEFTWLDIETLLHRKGLFSARSIAASAGGNKDLAENVPLEGRRLIGAAIERNGVLKIEEPTLEQSISRRLALFEEHAAGKPLKAYLNVGGGVASIGPGVNRKLLPAGLSIELDPERLMARSVAGEMVVRRIPIIHLLDVHRLARAYGLSRYPVPQPVVGSEPVFREERYRLGPTILLALLLVACTILAVEIDLFLAPRIVDRLRLKRRTTEPI
jgi:poly-gamma-glutamate system protein